MGTCYIVCALDCIPDFQKREGDLVIGADRGYLNLTRAGIAPDIVMGDFDSYEGTVDCQDIVRFPRVKDDTDSAIAIKHAVELGYKKITVYGAIGGSLDHTLANVAHLANYTQNGIDISFIDGENIIFAIHNSKISFTGKAKGRISVFTYGNGASGVCERGLFYELDNAELSSLVPLGISNEFTGKDSEISVKEGTLLIYTARENFEKHLTKR